MLEYIAKGTKIEVRRKSELIGLLTQNLEGYWGLHLQTCNIMPVELRSIANRLEELNKK